MPGDPLSHTEWHTTQTHRYRVNWRGKLILQVHEWRDVGRNNGYSIDWSSREFRWRDATIHDLMQPHFEGAGPFVRIGEAKAA